MNAIIIDDHPLARIAIRNLLDSNGITVAAELDSGAHAVQTAESMQPDLLIVDVDIPELSGIEVLEQLRKRRYQGTIIIISAKNELFYGKRSADCGANGFVSKKEGMNNILAAERADQKLGQLYSVLCYRRCRAVRGAVWRTAYRGVTNRLVGCLCIAV